MKINFEQLKKSTLFSGIGDEDLEKLVDCISPKMRPIKRGGFVFHAGDKVRSVYFILKGSMHIVDEDFWGNSSIVETMNEGVLFGEAYVFSEQEFHLVSVCAAEDSVVLVMNPDTLFETCASGCGFHSRLVKNALKIVSTKVVRLTSKLRHVMRRTLREKLFSYLSRCAAAEKSNTFYIPYSRQELADYLCADRSALSHELARMKKQGLIQYKKNYFELL